MEIFASDFTKNEFIILGIGKLPDEMMYLCDELIQVSFGVVCSLPDQCTFIPMKLSRFEVR